MGKRSNVCRSAAHWGRLAREEQARRDREYERVKREGTDGMVGGKVTGVARGPEGTLLNVEDDRHPGDVCSVRTVEKRLDDGTRVSIGLGDSVWWQSGTLFWTPRGTDERPDGECGKTWDVRLVKVGYSH